MPYVRRRRITRRRPMSRRRPRMSRRRSIYRPRRLISNPKIHHFKRTFLSTGIVGSTTDAFGAASFSFNNIPASSEFVALFDAYRINKIVVKYMPMSTEASTTQSTALFLSVIDYNDDVLPTTEDQLLEYENCKVTKGLKNHTRVFTPSTLDLLTDDTGATTYAGNPRWKQWIPTSRATVPHYGLKYLRQAQATGNLVQYRLQVTYYFSCKSVK